VERIFNEWKNVLKAELPQYGQGQYIDYIVNPEQKHSN